MSKITRAQLRGKPLDKECYRANRTTNEYGKDDNRVFCYGLYTEFSDSDINPECLKCKAYVGNAEPLKQIKDLTLNEIKTICDKHYPSCRYENKRCPLFNKTIFCGDIVRVIDNAIKKNEKALEETIEVNNNE